MSRSLGVTLMGESIHSHLKAKLGPAGDLSSLAVKTVERFERWKLPAQTEELDSIFPQAVLAFGGWKFEEVIVQGVAFQGYHSWLINFMERTGIETPSGPDMTEKVEKIATLYMQTDDLTPPPDLWFPDPNAGVGSLALRQYQAGMAIPHLYAKEITPVLPFELNEVDIDLSTITLAVVGDSYPT